MDKFDQCIICGKELKSSEMLKYQFVELAGTVRKVCVDHVTRILEKGTLKED